MFGHHVQTHNTFTPPIPSPAPDAKISCFFGCGRNFAKSRRGTATRNDPFGTHFAGGKDKKKNLQCKKLEELGCIYTTGAQTFANMDALGTCVLGKNGDLWRNGFESEQFHGAILKELWTWWEGLTVTKKAKYGWRAGESSQK